MDLRDVFRLRCSELLTTERDLWQMNVLMARATYNPKLKQLLEQHSERSRHLISKLEQIVDRLGGMMGPSESPIVQGMLRAHRLFMEMNPPREIIDADNALEAEKIEHLLLGAYTGLLTLAHHLEEREITEMLQQNQTDEQRMCAVIEGEPPTVLAAATPQRRAA